MLQAITTYRNHRAQHHRDVVRRRAHRGIPPGVETRAVSPRQVRPKPIGGQLKRAADVVIALAAITAAAPLLIGLALLIRRQDGGPAIYGHQRIGHRGRPFRCLKLRSMVCDSDAILARHLSSNPAARAEWNETRKLKDDPRITRVGHFVRRTSLDELPQIINVLRGEMSIVGPRPVTSEELARYGHNAREYLAARPGITGLWQISGRNDLSYERRVELDSDYVRRWSLLRDVKIILLTVPAVLKARGTY